MEDNAWQSCYSRSANKDNSFFFFLIFHFLIFKKKYLNSTCETSFMHDITLTIVLKKIKVNVPKVVLCAPKEVISVP